MSSGKSIQADDSAPRRLRVGSVSFLNSKPLIHGLASDASIELSLEVPSRLLEGLRAGRLDVALLPVIDYQRMEGLCIVPAGGIGSDGETLTVRVFGKCPMGQIKTLACDTDSHTSVALSRIIFAERYGTRPALVDLSPQSKATCDAMLLIGDKVVCEEHVGFEHQVDLGRAWKEITGLPFVFAVWTARKGVDLGDLPARLERAKIAGLHAVREIVETHAIGLGWPAGLALEYMTLYLKYDVGERQIEAIRRFHQLAGEHGVLEGPIRALAIYPR